MVTPTATVTVDALEEYRYVASSFAFDSFAGGNGFGPFTVQRSVLRNEILSLANPLRSIHISGSKASGKTILLRLLGNDLLGRGKTVFSSDILEKLTNAAQPLSA